MKRTINLLAKTSLIALVVGLALTTNYLYAAWSAPTANPPSNNTDAPINTGTASQVKDGALSVDGLSVVGNQAISGAAPRIEFSDTNHTDWWIHVDSNRVYFINDRNDNGNWSGEGPWPLELYAGASRTDDFALFSNKIRIETVCDRAGNNCTTPAQLSNVVNKVTSGSVAVYQCPARGSGGCPSYCSGQLGVNKTCYYRSSFLCRRVNTLSCGRLGYLMK